MAYKFNIDLVQDDVQRMCERHVEIRHNVDGIKSFARFQSGSQISEIKKNAGKTVVVVAAINGRRVGEKDDRMIQRDMILRIAVYAEKDGNVEDAKKIAIQKSEEIMLDLVTQMEKSQEDDTDGDVACSMWRFLRPEEFSWEEIEDQPWLINHYGWDLTVPFRVYMPNYNADKWIAE